MLKNLLTVALRNLRRKWTFSLINVLGLAVGMACFFLIAINVRDEFSYDRFHERAGRIHRVALERIYPANTIFYSFIPYSIGDAILADLPDVERMTRIRRLDGAVTFQRGETSYEEDQVLFVEPDFFRVFDVPFIQGGPETPFPSRNSLVLTRRAARRVFGDEDPIGQQLTTPQGPFLVSAICEDPPGNSHMKYDFLAPLALMGFQNRPDYLSFSVHTYLLLREGASPAAVEARFPGIVEKYAAGPIQEHTGISYRDYIAAGNGYRYFLQPLTGIRLHSNLEGELEPNVNAAYVYVLMAIAAFLIVIAGINFVNLTTARSAARAREVGLRKIAGTTRGALIRQFLVEALLTSLLAVIAAAALAKFLLPVFNGLARKSLEIHLFRDPFQPALLLGIGIAVGLLAGLYPAFVLSSYSPAAVLKGRFAVSRRGVRMRNALVVLQFTLSIVCIAMTLLVQRQLEFMRRKDLGFSPKEVVVVDRAFALRDRGPAFKQAAAGLPGVVSIAGADTFVSGGRYFGVMFQASDTPEIRTTRGMTVDEDFVRTLGLEILEGRGFSREFNEAWNVLVNETAVREFGWANPIGKKIRRAGEDFENPGDYTIVGVVNDSHYNSLHAPINSFVYFCYRPGDQRVFGQLNVLAEPGRGPAVTAALDRLWRSFGLREAFRSVYLDDQLEGLYGNERTSGRILGLLSLLTVLVACIGLFGLSSYLTSMRTREIGIRRVLGSTASGIVVLLSRDFARLVLLALAIALPFAYIAGDRWLRNFAFRAGISPWIFLAAGAAALIIEQLTISLQAFRAANRNPADALRFE